jgi:E3 ubiquitin-protein ligase BRE1
LASRAKQIKSKLSSIFTNLSSVRGKPSSDVHELQKKLSSLLGAQKEYLTKLERLKSERDDLSDRLETASLRYIKAEKRLDRAKSSVVAKLEQQAIAGSSSGNGAVQNGSDIEMTDNLSEENEANQTAYKEAAAVVAKQKEQLEAIMTENKSLTEQLSAANTRLSNLNEDDYARTELFKQFRLQHEDVIRRINHLEATNIQLREEAEKYQAERTAYRAQIENEAEVVTGELESQVQRMEADLTRIRSTRDELLADLSMRKASSEQDKTSSDHLNELISAKDDRITSLEAEVERLRARAEEESLPPRAAIEALDLQQLRQKYESLERQFEAIERELPGLQTAYKKVQTLSTKKVMDFTTLEEKVQILHAEKAKADQKYFAARKDMDTRILEVRSLKIQNQKSSEIIQQLKEVETANRNLLSNLEKQLSDIRQANASIITEHKKMESTSREATSKAETLKNQVTELTNLIKAKDANNLNTKQRIHDVEIELEQIRVKYEQAQKDRDTWKTKSLSNQSGEEEMLRVSSNAQGSLSLLTMLDSCSVHYLPEQLQERRHQDVWSYFLQQLC